MNRKHLKTFFKRELPRSFFYSFTIFFALLAAGTVAAWSAPSNTPPTCTPGNPGCDAPLNIGSTQTKNGGLNILGNVGVGQSAPNAKLDVSNNGGSDGLTITQAADNTEDIQAYIDGHYADRATYAGGCCNVLALQPDVGQVGIGTRSPNDKFDVNAAGAPAVTWTSAFSGGTNAIYASNPAGYYSELDTSSGWGLYTNGNIGTGGATLATNGDLYMPWKGEWLSQALSQASPAGNTTYWDTWYGSSYLGSNGNLYLGYVGDWLSNRLNQSVTTNSAPQFSRIWDDDGTHFVDSNVQSYMSSILLDGDVYSTSGAVFQYNGDIYMPWAGEWLSQALSALRSVQLYECPNDTVGSNQNVSWWSQGCVGQISSVSTCTNWWYSGGSHSATDNCPAMSY